ncbi:MAG: Cof-type HAD-IIB family hydrolase [Clostridiales bacterium]|nr:Cof-type HAD-IIB family hydrolase [Clostridiales bacterium]
MIPLRAAVFDLDDTLLRDDLSISPFTMETLRKLSASGFTLVAASGRAKMSMLPFVKRIGCVPLYIACNGAEIWDTEKDELLHSEMFSADLAREIASFGVEHGVYAQTYAGEYFFYNERSPYAERYAAASVLKGKYVGDLRDFIREPRNKILMMAEEDQIAAMLTEARERFAGRASVTCSKAYFLEFNPPGATKGTALEFVSDYLGIPLSEFVAFGDSLNDLPMFRAAGRSVIVANGREDVRPLCDDVCPGNMEDGVARYLAGHFLSGEEKL